MAEIYLARARGSSGFEKQVVLKRILPHVADDPKFIAMFLDEARLAATLRHANIADVYDVGEADDGYFFTMEYVHGQDVRSIRAAERERKQLVPLPVALALAHAAAAALHHAHEKGIVHRDVSSSNVLVSYDGAVKLVDFGIARAASSRSETQAGTLKGKIPYMSPEQAKGQPVDRRSDLWSLGVVLYELTTGRRPFRGDNEFALLEKIVRGTAERPSETIADYPSDLEAIVMKLLEHDPTLRYPTGADLIHDLEQLVADQRLWMSPNKIAKYMRALFAERIAAEEHEAAEPEADEPALEAEPDSLPEPVTVSTPSVELPRAVARPTPAPIMLPLPPPAEDPPVVAPEAPPPPRTRRWIAPVVAAAVAILGFAAWRVVAPEQAARSAPPAPVATATALSVTPIAAAPAPAPPAAAPIATAREIAPAPPEPTVAVEPAPRTKTVARPKQVARAKPADTAKRAKPAARDAAGSFDAMLEASEPMRESPAKPAHASTELSTDDFKHAMAAIASRARACYAGTAGTVALRLAIAPSGAVTKLTVTGAFAGKPEGECVAALARAVTFPSWDGKPQSFGYAYLLSE